MCLNNEMKRDGRQNRAKSHALVVSVTDFTFWSLRGRFGVVPILLLINNNNNNNNNNKYYYYVFVFSIQYISNGTQILKRINQGAYSKETIFHSVQLYLKLSLFKKPLLKRTFSVYPR